MAFIGQWKGLTFGVTVVAGRVVAAPDSLPRLVDAIVRVVLTLSGNTFLSPEAESWIYLTTLHLSKILALNGPNAGGD